MNQDNIRNFCIIAHIDAGKSTLSDRMLELTGTVERDKIKPQMLDMMDLERERGITIKLQPVKMTWQTPSQQILNPKSEILNKSKVQNDKNYNSKNLGFRASDLEIADSAYTLNLIDTPGHVDFSYEVSRSLKAVEGAILLVDATKGIQAQTLANLHLAKEQALVIIPVINKIDLPNAETERVAEEIADCIKISQDKILRVSAKTGVGVEAVLDRIVQDIPAPQGERDRPFKALIFDSVYDTFRGVIAYVRVYEGEIKAGQKIKFLASEKQEEAREVGYFKLKYDKANSLRAGEIGYLATGARDLSEVQVGDTIGPDSPLSVSPIAGFKKPQPMVFASIYAAGDDTTLLRTALQKLKLNDSSLTFTPENSAAFGQGFRCGFLGLLHLEITKSRLEREYGLELIVTSPQVNYREDLIHGKIAYSEPWARLEIITPKNYLGPIMELLPEKRGQYVDTTYLADLALLIYEVPLGEIIIDFYDKLKSVSSGYASQNYELIGWRPGDLVRLDVLVAGAKIPEFSRLVPRTRAGAEAQKIARKLKDLIPRQMFEVSIQVAQDGKILAREDIGAMRKDVTAKLYGGDVTRKNKLLKKQAKGKKKMKQIGRVEIPNNVFIDLLKS